VVRGPLRLPAALLAGPLASGASHSLNYCTLPCVCQPFPASSSHSMGALLDKPSTHKLLQDGQIFLPCEPPLHGEAARTPIAGAARTSSDVSNSHAAQPSAAPPHDGAQPAGYLIKFGGAAMQVSRLNAALPALLRVHALPVCVSAMWMLHLCCVEWLAHSRLLCTAVRAHAVRRPGLTFSLSPTSRTGASTKKTV